MDADYDIFEIVSVIRDFWLIDAESYQRKYCTEHGQALAPGYYVVNWPEQIRVRRFNYHAMFHGPFNSRKEAQDALKGMHEAKELVLTGAPEISSVAALNISSMEVMKADSQKLHPVQAQKLRRPLAA